MRIPIRTPGLQSGVENNQFEGWGLRAFQAIHGHFGGTSARCRVLKYIGAISSFLVLSGCAAFHSADLSTRPLTQNMAQNWSASEIRFWSTAPVGSRLMPYSWYLALEKIGSDKKFSDLENLVTYGYLPPRNADSSMLPVGFAIDRRADAKFSRTKLKWYAAQKHTSRHAEPWIGFNCAACHTKDLDYDGTRIRIYGGDSSADLQALVEGLGIAARGTLESPGKWARFSQTVLGEKNTHSNRAILRSAFHTWLSHIERFSPQHAEIVRYGVGRTDAFGQIFNAMTQIIDPDNPQYEAPNAAVNYPAIWNNHRQKHIQWNGYATNRNRTDNAGRPVDLPALGRNMGSIIGSFGDIGFSNDGGRGLDMGITTSLHLDNLIKLENLTRHLKAPAWPTSFPPMATGKAERGRHIFEKHCTKCHFRYGDLKNNQPSDVLVPFGRAGKRHLTDIWAACNIFSRETRTGKLAGKREFLFAGARFGETAPMHSVVTTLVWAAVTSQLSELIPSLPRLMLGSKAKRRLTLKTARPAIVPKDRRGREQACRQTDHPLLAYKARPLDGIWASAPYLHNGSVPTLYDLLLPASKRPTRFWLGDRQFDPVKVGISKKRDTRSPVRGFMFRVHDKAGQQIPGNSNAGHEYGVDYLNHDDRLALIEYLKGLQ